MNLKQRIKQAGITQLKLAELMDIHPVTLSTWVSGLKTIPTDREEQAKLILNRYITM